MTGSPGSSASAILNQSLNTPQRKSRAFTRASAVNEHTNTNYYMTMGQTMAANYSSNMEPFSFPASAESYTCGRNNASAIGGQPQVPYANMDPTMDFVDDTTAATTVPLPINNMNYNMTMEQTNDIVMNDPVDNEVYAFEDTFGKLELNALTNRLGLTLIYLDTLQSTKELNVANYTTANAMPENMYTHQDRARAVQDTVMTDYNTLEATANEYTSGKFDTLSLIMKPKLIYSNLGRIVKSAQDTATNSASLESNVVNPPGSAAKSRVNKSPTKKKRTQSPLEQLKYGFEWNKPSPELGCDGSRTLRSRETRVKAAGSSQDTKPIASAATVPPPGPGIASSTLMKEATVSPPEAQIAPCTPMKEAAADSQGTKQDLPLDIIDVPDDVARPIKPLKSAGKGKAKQPTKKKTSKASQAPQASKASQATVTADAADTIKPESDLIDIGPIEPTVATTSIEQGATGQIQHEIAAPPAPSPPAPSPPAPKKGSRSRPKRKCTTASINYGDEAKEVQPENTSTQLTIGEQDHITQQQNDIFEATSSQINLIDIQPTGLPIAEEQNIEQVSGSKVKSDRKIRFPRTKRTRIKEAKNGQEGVPATEVMIGEQQINAEQLTMVTGGCSSGCKRNAKIAQVDIEEEEYAQVNITTTETLNNEQQMEGVQLADVSSSKSSAKRPRRAKEPKVQHNEEGEDLLQAIHPTTDLQIIEQQTDVGQSTGTPAKRRKTVGRKTKTTKAEIKQSDIIAPTSTKRSAKGKEREVITVDAEETPPVAPVGEPVTEKRGRSRAKAPVTPKSRASRRQPSVKATEAKAAPATESDYRELDEVEVRETEISSSSKIQRIIVETDEQEGEEETAEKMKDTEEEKEQDEGIKFLLTNKNSPLATADLRVSYTKDLKHYVGRN